MELVKSRQITVGHYEVQRELGRGPMSIVYLAHDERSDRAVALKLLPSEVYTDVSRRDHFEHLAQSLTSLDYPGIVPVVDFGVHDGQPYIVSQYKAGRPLQDQIELGPMALLEAVRYLEMIGPALSRAHQRDLAHGNLHPNNVLFDAFGAPSIVDFGLASLGRPFAEVEGAGIYGNPYYAAPEAARGAGITPLGDVYALGVMLFHMLAGAPPFQGEDSIQTLQAHLEKPIPNLRTTRPDLPDSVQAIIVGALAKDPFERFQQPGEFLDALVRVVANEIGVDEDELYAASYPPPPRVRPQSLHFGSNDTVPEWYANGEAFVEEAYTRPDDFLATLPADDEGVGEVGRETVPYLGGGGRRRAAASAAEDLSGAQQRGLRRRERAALGAWRQAQARRAGMNELMIRLAGFTFPPVIQWTLLGVLVAVVALWFQVSGALSLITCAVADLSCPDLSAAIPPTATPARYPTSIPTIAPDTQTLRGHGTSRIDALAFSPNASQFVSGAEDNLVILWDAQTGQQTFRLSGHTAPITDVAYRPDGERLATTSRDGTTIIWNTASGTAVRTLTGHAGDVVGVAWSPDGTQLATAGADGHVLIHDMTANAEVVRDYFGGAVLTRVAYSTDEILAVGTVSELVLYNAAIDAEIRRIDMGGPVLSLALAPNGEMLAAGSTEVLNLVSPLTGTVLDSETGRRFFDVAWSADSTRIADASFFAAVVWDVATHAVLREYFVEDQDMVSVAWSQNSDEWLVTGASDGAITVWDYEVLPFTGVPGAPQNPPADVGGLITVTAIDAFQQWRWLGGHGDIVRSIAFSPDNTQMYTGAQDGRLFPWNVRAGRARPAFNRDSGFVRWVTTTALRPGGDILASTGSRIPAVSVWDVVTGELLTTLEGHGSEATTAVWSPDGNRLAVGANDGSIHVWVYDADSRSFSEEHVLSRHQTPVNALAFSPDGSRLASVEQNTVGTLIFWDVASGEQLGDLITLGEPAVDLAWGPSTQVAAAVGRRIVLLDPNSGMEQATFVNPTDQPVLQVDWSADATVLAVGTLGGRLLLFNTVLANIGTYTLEGDHGPLTVVQFSPDGRILGTGYSDGLIVLWGELE